ncbi:MAG: hypothetical protein LBS32_08335 [Clostridiales Family XIII bacterium]|jgi:hypothetical protein|nr:hypothetical protein [Clostridiales Family XIII bacterium]
MLSCGVKFCGGCNPRYDRKAACEEIRRRLDGVLRFGFASEGERFDLLLYMAGCPSRCTDLSAYAAPGGTAVCWDADMVGDTAMELERLAERRRGEELGLGLEGDL